MTLESIYYVGQTVAVVVIVATLFAILYQGYQTNKIARAQLTNTVWMTTGSMHASLMDTAEKADFMFRALLGDDALTGAEKIRFGNLLGMAVGTHEAAFMLKRRGFVEESAYIRIAAITQLYFESPRVRQWWRVRSNYGYDAEFRALIDSLSERLEAAAPARKEHQT